VRVGVVDDESSESTEEEDKNRRKRRESEIERLGSGYAHKPALPLFVVHKICFRFHFLPSYIKLFINARLYV